MAITASLAAGAATSAERGSCETAVDVTHRSKYKTVGRLLARSHGTLLDVGARDGVLRRALPASIQYRSADIRPGCDFIVDLERRLPFDDESFDYVVALDVLEHVDNFHAAFHELLRIARKGAVIGLPNMAFLSHRVSFALYGRLSTDKYDLVPAGATDRHRWLTTSRQGEQFMRSQADCGRLTLTRIVREAGGNRPGRLLACVLMRLGLPFASVLTDRTIFWFEPQRPGLSGVE